MNVLVLMALALAVATASCGDSEAERQLRRADAAYAEATARLALPDFDDRIEPVEAGTRLAVTLTGVHVDNSQLVRKLSRGEDAFWEWHDPRRVIVSAVNVVKLDGRHRPPGEELLIPDLERALKNAANEEKTLQTRSGLSWKSALNVFMDSRIPYSTVVRIIYTARQAGYENLFSVVRVGAREGTVPVVRAKVTPGPDHMFDRCAEPVVVLHDDALFLTVLEGGRGKGNRWVDLSPQGLTAAFDRVAQKDGSLDLVAFEASLKRKIGDTAPCNIARVAADDDIPWREIMAAVGVLRRVAPFEWMTLTTAASHPRLDMGRIVENMGASRPPGASPDQMVQE